MLPMRECVAVVEQPVELAAVALELGAGIEDLAEHVLHDGDVLADAELAAELLLDIGRGRKMIGMDVGLENPIKLEIVSADMSRSAGRRSRNAVRPADEVIVEHRIDDGADRWWRDRSPHSSPCWWLRRRSLEHRGLAMISLHAPHTAHLRRCIAPKYGQARQVCTRRSRRPSMRARPSAMVAMPAIWCVPSARPGKRCRAGWR